MNASRYVGIPYVLGGRARDGADCYGVVVLVYREEYGIELPPLNDDLSSAADRQEIERIVQGALPDWRPVPAPEVGDVVLLRMMGHASHVGICLGEGLMLTTRRSTGATVERLEGLMWRNRLDSYYRHPSKPS